MFPQHCGKLPITVLGKVSNAVPPTSIASPDPSHSICGPGSREIRADGLSAKNPMTAQLGYTST